MNRSKYNALCKEFPFIPETVLKNDAGGMRYNIQYCDYLQIRQVTRVLLGKIPKDYLWPNNKEALYHIMEWEQVHFVLKDDTIIRDAVNNRSTYCNRCEDSSAETILEAILRRNVVWNLQFIVLVEGGYNIFRGRSQPNFHATIYKLKKGTTYDQLIYEAEKAAREWEQYFYYNPYGFSR